MSQEANQTEDLNKSIDALIDAYFVDGDDSNESVEKSDQSMIAQDSKTTADAAVNQAPKAQDDDSRGAGRPSQISDVPKNDQDGQRAKNYDDDISENDDKEEDSPEKDQVPSIDQTSEGQGRLQSKPAAPKMRPFMKSENGEEIEISEDEYKEFQAFKKSQEEKAAEDLKKAEAQKQEDLIKSAVDEALSKSNQEIADLKKSLDESNALVKAMASQPQQPKTVTGIDALEKGMDPDMAGPQTFSKAELLDAAESLVMEKSLPMEAVIELENTGSLANPQHRALVERKLSQK